MENELTSSEDRILNSLSGIQRAEAPAFFYTRLLGRMQRETESVKRPSLIFRPAFATAVLALFFVVNTCFLLIGNRQQDKRSVQVNEKPATIESFARAYQLESESLYE
ncbi:MAG: hypothetical protein IPP31_11595 [Chitinophagaceae bacterium]|nr:hypothetical protein [Chitinophagaceae bacterium]